MINRPKNKRIFITGGAGYLGKHLVEDLIHDNELVYFLVLASSGIDHDVKIWQPTLEHLPVESEHTTRMEQVSFGGLISDFHLASHQTTCIRLRL